MSEVKFEDAHLLLQNNYDLRGNLSQLSTDTGKAVFRVQTTDGRDLVLRVQDCGSETSLIALAGILLLLHQKGYAAEQISPTIHGFSVARGQKWCGLLTTYLGTPLRKWSAATHRKAVETETEIAPWAYQELGSALGRLHTLPLNMGLPLAGMLPEPELAFADACLKGCKGIVPGEWQPLYERLTWDIATMNRGDSLPQVLLHNDCHPGNAVYTSDGSITLVDWEGAGRGPAIIDLGFMLAECCQGILQCPNPDSVTAVIVGYQQHRLITPVEWSHLADAIRFRTLVLLAASFPMRIAADYDAKNAIYGRLYEEWLARYDATDEIMAIVCR